MISQRNVLICSNLLIFDKKAIIMKRKIKILETIRQGQIGGGESHVLDLVTHLDKDEFTPVVLSFTDGFQNFNFPFHDY